MAQQVTDAAGRLKIVEEQVQGLKGAFDEDRQSRQEMSKDIYARLDGVTQQLAGLTELVNAVVTRLDKTPTQPPQPHPPTSQKEDNEPKDSGAAQLLEQSALSDTDEKALYYRMASITQNMGSNAKQNDGGSKSKHQVFVNKLTAAFGVEGMEHIVAEDESLWLDLVNTDPHEAALQNKLMRKVLLCYVTTGQPKTKLDLFTRADDTNKLDGRGQFITVREAFRLHCSQLELDRIDKDIDAVEWKPKQGNLDAFIKELTVACDDKKGMTDKEGRDHTVTPADFAKLIVKKFKTCPHYTSDERRRWTSLLDSEIRRIERAGDVVTIEELDEVIRAELLAEKAEAKEGRVNEQRADITCYHCHEKGHIKAHCPKKNKNQPKGNSDRPRRLTSGDRPGNPHRGKKCDYCGIMHHVESVCRKKKADMTNETTNDGKNNKQEYAASPQVDYQKIAEVSATAITNALAPIAELLAKGAQNSARANPVELDSSHDNGWGDYMSDGEMKVMSAHAGWITPNPFSHLGVDDDDDSDDEQYDDHDVRDDHNEQRDDDEQHDEHDDRDDKRDDDRDDDSDDDHEEQHDEHDSHDDERNDSHGNEPAESVEQDKLESPQHGCKANSTSPVDQPESQTVTVHVSTLHGGSLDSYRHEIPRMHLTALITWLADHDQLAKPNHKRQRARRRKNLNKRRRKTRKRGGTNQHSSPNASNSGPNPAADAAALAVTASTDSPAASASPPANIDDLLSKIDDLLRHAHGAPAKEAHAAGGKGEFMCGACMCACDNHHNGCNADTHLE
jgi:hypothetical protein